MVQDTPIRQKAGSKNIAVPVIAGAAGLALLAGGTTFALWSSQATIDATTISTGTLTVTTDDQEFAWYDTNAAPFPALIEDIDEFTAIGGSAIRGHENFTLTIDGTDLSAELTVTGGGLSDTDGVSGTVEVYAGDDGPPFSGEPIAEGTLTGGNISWTDDDFFESLSSSDSGEYQIVVFLEFDEDNQVEGGSLTLGEITFTLTQLDD